MHIWVLYFVSWDYRYCSWSQKEEEQQAAVQWRWFEFDLNPRSWRIKRLLRRCESPTQTCHSKCPAAPVLRCPPLTPCLCTAISSLSHHKHGINGEKYISIFPIWPTVTQRGVWKEENERASLWSVALVLWKTGPSFTLRLDRAQPRALSQPAITTHGRAAAVMSQAISRAPTAAISPVARLSLLSFSGGGSISPLSLCLFFFFPPSCASSLSVIFCSFQRYVLY